ncbi:RecQ-mediated genome instability protein 1, partial [Operophtera brumata]
CVEYLCEDSNNTEADIKKCAREQWLLNDLKEICPGSLPANLKDQLKTVLNGRFVLQINAAMDIGTPAYQQNLKLQKVNMENVEATSNYEDKISSHRGMLLLTEGAIELLGGEVGEITVSNSLAGLLSAKLGLPMTQVGHPRNATIPTPHSTQMPPPALIHEPPADHRSVARVTSLQVSGAFSDDDTDIDMDQLAEIEAQITDVSTKRPLTNALSNPEKKIKIDLTTNDEDYLREMEAKFDAVNNEPCTSINKGPIPLSVEPYVYIKQINDLPDSKRLGRVFKVKGQIMKLLSKLSVGKDGWTLKCTIVDGTGSIDVDFTSQVPLAYHIVS